MVDFSVPANAETLGREAREFAARHLNDDLVRRDRAGGVEALDWRPGWAKAAEFGLLGLTVPEAWGGAGHDVATAVHILQEVGYGCADGGLLLGMGAQIWPFQMPLLEFASDELKDRYLPGLVRGQIIAAHAVTELASGSDAMALATTAKAVDGGFVLNGEKAYIGMAPECDLAMVFATHDQKLGAWGVSAFLVEAKSKGFHRGAPEQKMGTRTMPMGSLRFEDCFVPESAIVGRKGAGAAIFNRSLEWERRFILSGAVGAMRRQLESCAEYATSRQVFGGPIAGHQSVGNRLADMRMRYETARLMLQKAAWDADRGMRDPAAAALVKLHISEAYLASGIDAMRNFGGRGYLEETGIERPVRDALGAVTYGGTSDILRQIIAAKAGDVAG